MQLWLWVIWNTNSHHHHEVQWTIISTGRCSVDISTRRSIQSHWDFCILLHITLYPSQLSWIYVCNSARKWGLWSGLWRLLIVPCLPQSRFPREGKNQTLWTRVIVVLQLAIPLLNIPSIDFSLKTELVGKLIIHCFSHNWSKHLQGRTKLWRSPESIIHLIRAPHARGSSGPKGREDCRSINSWDRWQHWLKKASMSPLSCFETPPRPPSIYQTSLSSWLTTMFLGRGTRLLKVEWLRSWTTMPGRLTCSRLSQ